MPTVLLVDDDESSRVTLGALLEDEGFVVHAAQSSAEARGFIAGDIAPDVVLLDEHLGDGLGSDLVPAIRECWPGSKVVLMSGSVDTIELPEVVDASFAKGNPFEDLSKALQNLLG